MYKPCSLKWNIRVSEIWWRLTTSAYFSVLSNLIEILFHYSASFSAPSSTPFRSSLFEYTNMSLLRRLIGNKYGMLTSPPFCATKPQRWHQHQSYSRKEENVSVTHSFQTDPWTHPGSYPTNTLVKRLEREAAIPHTSVYSVTPIIKHKNKLPFSYLLPVTHHSGRWFVRHKAWRGNCIYWRLSIHN